MLVTSRDRAIARLTVEINQKPYTNLLRALHLREPFLRQFEAWSGVLEFMRVGTSADERKDKILRPLFDHYREKNDERCYKVLLTIFWPALESISHLKRSWDADVDERWSNIFWAFMRTVRRLDTTRRPERIVQKIYWDLVHDLYEIYKKAWKQRDREIASTPKEIEVLAGDVDGVDFEAICLRQEHARKIEYYKSLQRAGVIRQEDRALLVGTRLYGQTLLEYARSKGLSCEAAKKRRQRAEAKIRAKEV